MTSLLNWILGSRVIDLYTELCLTFGIITFIVLNLFITIYSRELSEEQGAKNSPELWIKRRCRASGQNFENIQISD